MAHRLNYHFIGINGIGMSALAKICAKQGHRVSGSDSSSQFKPDQLRAVNIRAYSEHCASHVRPDHIVVVSSAISKENIEFRTAKQLGCKMIKRGRLLADIAQTHDNQIIIAGTHGKTTTSSMIRHMFQVANRQPSFFIGGHMKGEDENGAIYSSDVFISEADESDGSFLDMRPTYAVITNIEQDHLDFYETKKRLIDAFQVFFNTAISNGTCALNIDDPHCKKLIKGVSPESIITFGLDDSSAIIHATDIQYKWNGISFKLMVNNAYVEHIQLNAYGRHNVYNACAAIAISMANQISLKDIIAGLATYKGICRRLELKYKANDMMLFDDYAHHPTAVASTLEGLYKSFPNHRIVAIFQPHRYSRLTDFFDGFSNAFGRAAMCFIGQVYSAGEKKNGHKTSHDLVQKMKRLNENTWEFDQPEQLTNKLATVIQPKDIIVLMGAGDITDISKDIIPMIKKECFV